MSDPVKAKDDKEVAPANAIVAYSPDKNPGLPKPTLASRVLTLARENAYHAAAIAIALGCGWIVGANSFDTNESPDNVVVALRALDAKIDAIGARSVGSSEIAELRSGAGQFKIGLDATRNNTAAAIAQLTTKFDRLDREQAARLDKFEKEQAARLDRLTERFERVERQVTSPTPTASIPQPPPPAALPPVTLSTRSPGARADETSIPQKNSERAKIPLNGYVLREVRNGAALVENRAGLIEVIPGDILPGAGRVRAIERKGRQWVVVTSGGTIDMAAY